MRVVHYPGKADEAGENDENEDPEGGSADEAESRGRTIATRVDVAETRLQQARGLMFRRSIPEEYALVFPFEESKPRDLHMLFVPFSIDAVWIEDGTVTATKRLRPFLGLGRARADTVIELPAGAADRIEPGDRIGILEA